MRLKPDTPTPNFGDHEGPGHFQIFLQLKFFPHDIFSQKKKKKKKGWGDAKGKDSKKRK